MRGLQDKVVLIVGGGTGIGAATALRLAEEGAKVVIADIAIYAARETATRIGAAGGTACALSCDVTSEEDVRELFGAVEDKFDRLDAIHVNVADTLIAQQDTDVTTVPMDVFDRTIAVNLRGHVLVTRHGVPMLIKRPGSSIVYTSSRGGLTSEPVRVSYATSKSGLHALMRHVALTWGKQGLRANVVAPGTVMTPALRTIGDDFVAERLRATPSPRLGRPEDIAAAVAFLMSDDAAFINGQIVSIDGGVTMR